jgi:hypothetical protein
MPWGDGGIGGSRYAPNRSGGGSPYAPSRGGWGSGGLAGGTAPSKQAAKHGGGGLLGALSGAAHWTASKAGKAAHDVKAIPGGTIDLVNRGVVQPWKDVITTGHVSAKTNRNIDKLINEQSASVRHTLNHPFDDPLATFLTVNPVLHGAGKTVAAARAGDAGALVRRYEPPPRLLKSGDAQVPLHPSRNPAVRAAQGGYDKRLQKALDTNPEGKVAAHAARRIGGSLSETARYQQRMREAPANTLERAGAKLRGKGEPPRKVQQAALRLVSENSTAKEAARYHLDQAAKGVSAKRNLDQARLYQEVHRLGLLTKDAHGDVVVDAVKFPKLAAVDVKLARGQAEVDKIIAKHGEMTPAALRSRVDAPGRVRAGATYEKPTPGKAGVSPALIRATAERDRLAALHERALTREAKWHTETKGGRAASGSAPLTAEEAQARLADLYARHQTLLEKLVPAVSPYGGDLSRREQFSRNFENTKPRARVKPTVKAEELQLAEQRLHELTQTRPDHPAVKEYVRLTAEREQLQHAINRSGEASLEGVKAPPLPPSGKPVEIPPVSNPHRNTIVQLGTRLEAAQAKVDRVEAAVEKRQKPTGIVGGETARPGRGFVPYKTLEQKAPNPLRPASASGPIVGKTRPFISKKPFTGHGLEHGIVPDNTTGLVARNMRRAYRYVSTDAFRRDVYATGSPAKRTSRDVLVADQDAKAGKIPAEVDAMLGRKMLTTDELAGHEAAFSDYMQRLIPGLRNKFADDRAQQVGTQAPDGFRWVDRGVLGDLAKQPAGQRGRIARSADTVNSAVTAATVYFKVGHIGTRALTNASTTILQGSATPLALKRAVGIWKDLSYEDRRRALAAAGQHGYDAMPHEGVNLVGRGATRGAQWWARHIDAPFRFASIAYEARKAGFDTPAKFVDLLDKLEDPSGLDPATAARVDRVAKEANRAGIAYDRLNATERNYITRGVWFYPWVKGATVFGARTLTEHPYKSAALGLAGVHGREKQIADLGDVPSYEQGLFKLAGADASGRPLVADFSTFSPFATPADVVQAAVRPAELSGFANPVLGAAAHLASGQDAFGQPTTSPVTSALAELFSPTPEAQMVSAYLQRHQDQSRRMFPKSSTLWGTRDPLLRALLGPGLPRRVNPAALQSAAARERSGR